MLHVGICLLFQLHLLIAQDFHTECPPPWSYSGPYCYYYKNSTKDWITSWEDCNDMGGNLVTIDSDHEGTRLLHFRATKGTQGNGTWVGLTGISGNWMWSGNSELGSWSKLQLLPAPRDSESLALLMVSSDSFVWQPSSRSLQYASICELGVAINGGWGMWSTWSSCDCNTLRSRVRSCDSPVPKEPGNDCEGPKEERKECNLLNCIKERQWHKLGVDCHHKPSSPVVSKTKTVSKIQCAVTCASHTSCKSYSYKLTGGACELLDEYLESDDLETTKDWECWTNRQSDVIILK